MLTVSRRWRILLRARRFSSAVDVDKSALRFVRIHGLPTGYNLSEIVTAARGGPILQVVPAENEVLLKFYSWTQAAACSKAPIKVESGEYRAELDKSGNGELIGADVVARLGGLQAHRTLQVHFPPGHKFMVPTNVEHWLTPTGPREFCRTFETKSGKAGANIAFLDEEDAFHFSRMRKGLTGFRRSTCSFASFFPKKMAHPRRVLITEVSTEDATDLAEEVEAISVNKTNLGESITYMGHAEDTMTVDFRYPYQAAHFYRRFPAHTRGLKLHITPLQTTDFPMSLAMNSGAGRTLQLHLESPPTIASLSRHFEEFGMFDPKIDESGRVLLRFYSIHNACKAVHRMVQGDHSLPPKYAGVLISFAVKESIQNTRPVPIGATIYGWKKPFSWMLSE
ncbi:hypothetical protein CPB85DRAFT_1444609 [Mucidula mucida]|nr:hypothetical protein CPB85DRAFT_1444609 [Mucidula mucida]